MLNTCDTIADLEFATNLLTKLSLVSVVTKQMAQCLHNKTRISEVPWPAIHVLSSQNLKMPISIIHIIKNSDDFKGLTIAFRRAKCSVGGWLGVPLWLRR